MQSGKPRYWRSGNRPTSRADHGEALFQEASEALTTVAAARQAAGVDPTNLLVLEFDSENVGIRDQLEERFGAWVVDEKRSKTDDASHYTYVVQFPDQEAFGRFQSESTLYQSESTNTGSLPPAMRRDFFDALQHVRALERVDRMGRRLRDEGQPSEAQFYLDVDLWHPGETQAAQTLLTQIRSLCQRSGGRLTGTVRTSSLLLTKVQGNSELLHHLLDLDLVARVDLPPLIGDSYAGIFREPILPDRGRLPDDDDGLACIIDSGVISGHPLLANWIVEERDFDTGENTVVDQNGHGTAVAGLTVYGNVAACIDANTWIPRVRICSAKVLRHDPVFQGVVFPEENRIERVLEEAIRYFATERNCRIFNLSIGDEADVYANGRQFPLAEKLDEVARELDVVIVIAAGNRGDPPMPDGAVTREKFQCAVRDQTLHADQRICNPATAALGVSVGSIARSDVVPQDRPIIPGSPAGAPSPFTRSGPGYSVGNSSASAKPDFAACGGNYGMQTLAGGDPRWVTNLVYLGEPTIRPERDGRILGAQFGTSFAAPHVTHAAAIAERSLSEALGGRAPSANLIRALVGSSSVTPPCDAKWIQDENDRLRLVGHGIVDPQQLLWSHDNNVCLIAEETLEEDKLHFFRIRVPDSFLTPSGERGVTIALAYDPPVRASRKEYIARTMRFELLHGLTADQVEQYRAAYSGDDAPSMPDKNVVDLRPPRTWLDWSTLQVRRRRWSKRPQLKKTSVMDEPELYVLITCQKRFATGLDPRQRYGLVVRFWHSGQQVKFYQHLRSRIRTAARLRVEA